MRGLSCQPVGWCLLGRHPKQHAKYDPVTEACLGHVAPTSTIPCHATAIDHHMHGERGDAHLHTISDDGVLAQLDALAIDRPCRDARVSAASEIDDSVTLDG